MTKTLHATYDGHALCPDEPVNLKAGVRVLITIKSEEDDKSFLDVAQKLNISGPADWSEKLEEYLYKDSLPDE